MSKTFRFLPSQHIRSAAEFDAVFKQGKRFSFSCFALCFVKNAHDFPRLGLVISKKHCRLAVRRNRIKRIIREYFRLHQSAFPNVDVLVVLRSSISGITDEEQMTCLESLFSQLIAHCSGFVSN